MDADVIGLSEVDIKGGEFEETNKQLLEIMDKLGYEHKLFEKNNNTTASAIMYKKDKFNCIHAEQVLFEEGSS
jgi:hypothetical protein